MVLQHRCFDGVDGFGSFNGVDGMMI